MGATRMKRSAGWRRIEAPLAAALLALMILLPGLINRHPLIFPDSIGYFHSGEAAAGEAKKLLPHAPGKSAAARPTKTLKERQSDNISTARSVYYGFAFWTLYRLGGDWGLPLAQAAVTLLSLWLALPHLFGRSDPRRSRLAMAAVVAVSGLGAFAVALMPDLFGGLMLLGMAIVLAAWGRIPWIERGYWLLLILAACLFHKANVAIAVTLLGLYLLVALVIRRFPLWNVAAIAGALAIALAAHAAVAIMVEKLTGKPAVEVPFTLARVIGDGTAERYLRLRCPDAGYALCDHLHRFPMTENEFLWSPYPDQGLMNVVPPEESAQITREAPAVVIETVQTYPFAQAAASTRNAVRQFIGVGVDEFDRALKPWPGISPDMRALLSANQRSAVAQRNMPLPAISQIMSIAYLAAIAVIALLLPRLLRLRGDQRLGIVLLLCAGVAINAAVTGVVSGVFERYQGRVAWLLIAAAVAAGFMLGERRSGAARSDAPPDDQPNVVPLDVTTRSRAAR